MDSGTWEKFQHLEMEEIGFRQGIQNELKHGDQKAQSVFEINLITF